MKNLFLLFLIIPIILIGCSDKKNNSQPQSSDSNSYDNTSDTDAGNSSKEISKTQIVREGVIDLTSIDRNNDKIVFECPMDWNVLDDNAGSCPLCKMELEEFSLAEAKNNLVKNDYQVK